MKKGIISNLVLLVFLSSQLFSQGGKMVNSLIEKQVSDFSDEAFNKYIDLHSNPELSLMETATAGKMASFLRASGLETHEGIGGNGVVGVFRNGPGPVIMLRTDMDALPVAETTGLDWASRVVASDAGGNMVPVMHACGHDMHMTVWMGTVKALTGLKDKWKGTLIAIAQPAEEVVAGAVNMIGDGLYTRFPKPDYALCYHVSAELPAGTIGYFPGPIFAGVNSAEITVRGQGGHGAMPHTTVDPIVLAARTVLALQTIVSREINPVYPAVVTVGSIHGGTRSNIIPGEVKMELTLRFFDDLVYEKICNALERITRGIAISAGLTEERMPSVIIGNQFTPPVANDPELVVHAVNSMKEIIGQESVIQVDPSTVAEDFGRYGRTEEKVPIALFWLGSVNMESYLESLESNKMLPALHNSSYRPDFRPTFQTGVKSMTKAIIDLFNK